MGKLVTGKKYHYYEYVTAVGIWFGMATFQFFTENKHSGKFYFNFKITLVGIKILKCSSYANLFTDITTCAVGVILLIVYLASDSFTSTWQGTIFTQYQVTPMQMVFANSLLSSLLTTVSLYQVDSFKKTYAFIKEVFLLSPIVLYAE